MKTDGVENRWGKMPIWKRLEARRRIRMEVLLRRDEDGEDAKAEGVSEEEHFPGEKKERRDIVPPSYLTNANAVELSVLQGR